jgi:hypothetical protein
VNLSPDVILDQICKSFNLIVHNRDVVEGSNGMFHVRLEMDMPCVGGSAVTERVKLVGDPAASAVEAVEKMSQIVIDYLHHTVGVVVVDMHYARMKQLEKRLSKANAFASAFFDWVVDLKQNQSDSRDRVDELFRSGRDMVIGFGDVLPVGTFEVDGLGIAPNISTVTYLGPDPPVTRLDELALAVVSFMNHGPRSFGIGSTFVRKQCFLIWYTISAGPNQ